MRGPTPLALAAAFAAAVTVRAAAPAGVAPAAAPAAAPAGATARLVPVDAALDPDLFVFTDTANVYILRDGDAGLLIDAGDGGVVDHLSEIGVKRIEWVLVTHHHREQIQGHPRLRAAGAQFAGPETERALFEQPATFRKMKPRLSDRYAVHGASYVRPPVEPLKLDRGLRRMDTFSWRGREITCVETPGNSPGSLSYFVKRGGRWIAFSGDVMVDGARMHTWFDSEWDYGFGAGLRALLGAAASLEAWDPALLLPSHGPAIRNARAQLGAFREKVRRAERLLQRGYDIDHSNVFQDRVSRPTAVPHLWQISPHLYKLRGPSYFPNFALVLSDSGRGLLVDAGLVDVEHLDRIITQARERLGLRQIDAVLISHMHGDHFLNAPHLREKWGTQIWALDRMADQVQAPERFDYAAAVVAYGAGFDAVKLDRVLRSGEVIEWEGFRFTADWMPGQTEFAMCLHGVIDGRKVAFTGDHLFADARDPTHTGHEAVVARNSGILDEGYILGADSLRRLAPDIIVAGHSYVMDRPAALLERFARWGRQMKAAFQELSPDPDHRYWFDPFWVRADPYRVSLARGRATEVAIHVRNFRNREQSHRIALHAPAGVSIDPPVLEGRVARGARVTFPVRLTASPSAAPGVGIVALDLTIDGVRRGELFDFMIEVADARAGAQGP